MVTSRRGVSSSGSSSKHSLHGDIRVMLASSWAMTFASLLQCSKWIWGNRRSCDNIHQTEQQLHWSISLLSAWSGWPLGCQSWYQFFRFQQFARGRGQSIKPWLTLWEHQCTIQFYSLQKCWKCHLCLSRLHPLHLVKWHHRIHIKLRFTKPDRGLDQPHLLMVTLGFDIIM